MPDAMVLQVADAVAAGLNAASLSMAPLAERGYLFVARPEALGPAGFRVTVVPRETTSATLSRRDDDFDYVVDVAIQARCGREPTQIDPFLRLAEEFVDLFRGKNLVFGGAYDADHSALCVAVAQQPLFVPDHLDQFGVLTSVVTLTFRIERARP